MRTVRCIAGLGSGAEGKGGRGCQEVWPSCGVDWGRFDVPRGLEDVGYGCQVLRPCLYTGITAEWALEEGGGGKVKTKMGGRAGKEGCTGRKRINDGDRSTGSFSTLRPYIARSRHTAAGHSLHPIGDGHHLDGGDGNEDYK